MSKSVSLSYFYFKAKIGKLFANIISGFVRNKEKRHRLREKLDPLNPQRCVNYLAQHYTAVSPIAESLLVSDGTYVWVCWLQGEEQAPQMIRNCLQSVRYYKPEGSEVILITAENYRHYADLPEHIVSKWKAGIITNTHFSDLIRIFLLARHGGYWVDATCLLTSPFPPYFTDSPLFLFRSHGEFAYTLIQSCLIHCEKNHYVMRMWCAAMAAYWEREDRLINYFTLHLMFKALLQKDKHFADEYAKIPAISDEPMHVLLKPMVQGTAYSEELMQRAKESSFMQKLSYKFPAEILNDQSSLAYVLSQPLVVSACENK